MEIVAFSKVPGSHPTFVTPWIAACQSSLSITYYWSLLQLMFIVSVMLSNSHILISGCNSFIRGLIWYFGQTQGDSEGQGTVAYCSPWGCKESWQGHDLVTGPQKPPDVISLSKFQQHVLSPWSDPCRRTYRQWCQYICSPLFFQFVEPSGDNRFGMTSTSVNYQYQHHHYKQCKLTWDLWHSTWPQASLLLKDCTPGSTQLATL